MLCSLPCSCSFQLLTSLSCIVVIPEHRSLESWERGRQKTKPKQKHTHTQKRKKEDVKIATELDITQPSWLIATYKSRN